MTRKIFRSLFGLALFILLLGSFFMVLIFYRSSVSSTFSWLKMQTELVSQGMETEGMSYFSGLKPDGYRITLLRQDGTAAYDSSADISAMDNHADRPEIKDALLYGYGQSRRHSDTAGKETLYYAVRLSDGSVVRTSVTRGFTFTLLKGMYLPLLFVLLMAFLLSFYCADRLSRKIVKPINSIDLEKPLDNNTYEELTPLLQKIRDERKKTDERETELDYRQSEFDSLTKNMNEGMILLDSRDRILSINDSARELFHVSGSLKGTDFLSVNHSLSVQKLLKNARDDHRAEITMEIENGIYRMTATPVSAGGLVILTMDVTNQTEAEKIRREFTANVSHELKTPLQSIMGSAELIENGMVAEKDIPDFMKRIRNESARMVTLINDIMRLSQLDEGNVAEEKQNTDLADIAKDAIGSLREKAEQFGVCIIPDLNAGRCCGVHQLLSEIAVNLIDNAIKYNRRGGAVMVRTSTEERDCGESDSPVLTAVLKVSDTGVGIPAEDQKRVFERFYRVDKSRSKETGGTGLGLSIVKHAVQMNNGTIELESEPGKGTEITVSFPAVKR